jgi:hypothetical protein
VAARYTTNKGFRGAYIVDQKLLDSLILICRRYTSASPKIEFRLAGGESLRSENLDEVLNHASIGVQRISSIEIESSTRSNTEITDSRYVSLALCNNIISNTISISGSHGHIVYALQEIEQRLEANATFYKYIYKWCIFEIVSLLLSAAFYLCVKPSNPTENYISLFVLILLIIFSNFCLRDVRNYFLPRLVFCFGKSKRSYDSRLSVLKFFSASILLTVIIGVIVNYISKYLVR